MEHTSNLLISVSILNLFAGEPDVAGYNSKISKSYTERQTNFI